jgi:hypothetical protein
MAQWALVKLDDTEKTGSTGGVVERVHPYSGFPSGIQNPIVWNDELLPNYKRFKVNDKVQPGWILTSKTNIFVDTNVPIE